MNPLSISEFAKLVGKSQQTIDKSARNPNSKLSAYVITQDGRRYIQPEAIAMYCAFAPDEVVDGVVASTTTTTPEVVTTTPEVVTEVVTTTPNTTFTTTPTTQEVVTTTPEVVKPTTFTTPVTTPTTPNLQPEGCYDIPQTYLDRINTLPPDAQNAVENTWKIIEKDKHGIPKQTRFNFLSAMQNDKMFSRIRFNQLTGCREIHDGNKISKWTEDDESGAKVYLENYYGLSNDAKFQDAMRVYCSSLSYNPVKDVIDSIVWDGTERCQEFLILWGKAEDTNRVREISRLIFAGGICRLYEPGTKFDEVPVLVGTEQGEGKSTLARWLAVEDRWFGECNSFDGQESIEQLEGRWICEICEMLALTKNKDQETAKAYLARSRDSYRKPYERNVTDLPRKCIFIGTTNRLSGLLSDQTGGRRFHPVQLFSRANIDIYPHEEEIREYIKQCWAEAREKYKAGQMPPVANPALMYEFRAAQQAVTLDDWRYGVIEDYLATKPVGSYVCVREVFLKAVCKDLPRDLGRVETIDIGIMMDKMQGWKLSQKRHKTEWGQQKCWVKQEGAPMAEPEDDDDELPIGWKI